MAVVGAAATPSDSVKYVQCAAVILQLQGCVCGGSRLSISTCKPRTYTPFSPKLLHPPLAPSPHSTRPCPLSPPAPPQPNTIHTHPPTRLSAVCSSPHFVSAQPFRWAVYDCVIVPCALLWVPLDRYFPTVADFVSANRSELLRVVVRVWAASPLVGVYVCDVCDVWHE